MIKLKDILLEAQVAHTQKSLQWVYHGYIAMTPKVIKQIIHKQIFKIRKQFSIYHLTP